MRIPTEKNALKKAVALFFAFILVISIGITSAFAAKIYDGTLYFDENDNNVINFKLNRDEARGNCELLGIQVRTDDLSSVRFISIAMSDILDSADDYGYMFYTVDKNEKIKNSDLVRENIDSYSPVLTLSCKNTSSSVISGDYGNTVFDSSKEGYTRYKYITAGVNNISDDKFLAVRFYVKSDGEYQYASYKTNTSECIFSSTEVREAIKSNIEIVGHRGAMDIAPQNTLVSFEKAAEYGYKTVEADYWITESGDMLILHDEMLNICGHPEISVKTLTAETRTQYPVTKGSNVKQYETQYIPTLEELVKKVSELDLNLYLHTKDANTSDAKIDEIIEILKKYNMENRTIIYSSSKKCCIRISKHDCIPGFLVVTPTDTAMENGFNLCIENNVPNLMVNYKSNYPTSDNIKRAHALGLKIGVYNANNINDTLWLVENDCDYTLVNNWI